MSRSGPGSKVSVAVLIAGLALVVTIHGAALYRRPIDDAFISFRYARNFVEGQGLVFNPGEWVEGYSSLAWVWLAAASLRLGMRPENVVGAFSLGCLIVTLTAVTSFARSRCGIAWAGALGLALATSSVWVGSGLLGLETPLYSLLLAVIAMLDLAWADSARPVSGAAMGLLGMALAVTRPEGAAVLGALLIARALALRAAREPGGGWAQGLAWTAVIFLVGVGTLFAWRFATYGSLLPNSVAAKVGTPGAVLSRMLEGHVGSAARYLIGFFGGRALAASGLLCFCVWRARQPWSWVLARLPSLALVAVGIAVVIANNGDWMPHFRLLAPYLPVLAVAAVPFLGETMPRPALPVFVIVSLLTGPSFGALLAPRFRALFAADVKPNSWGRLGAALQDAHPNPGRAFFATEVLGELAYRAPRTRFVDLRGLTDADIAHTAAYGGTFGRTVDDDRLRRLAPELIAFIDLAHWRVLLGQPWFRNDYVPLACEELLVTNAYVFLRRDSPVSMPGRLKMCPPEEVTPEVAFRRASCLRVAGWPYDFPRDCPAPGR